MNKCLLFLGYVFKGLILAYLQHVQFRIISYNAYLYIDHFKWKSLSIECMGHNIQCFGLLDFLLIDILVYCHIIEMCSKFIPFFFVITCLYLNCFYYLFLFSIFSRFKIFCLKSFVIKDLDRVYNNQFCIAFV